jgi:CheY-like chemotaxis protein/tetratricopeptide (TPR) repeat protein
MAGAILHVDDAPELPDGLMTELERMGCELITTDDPVRAITVAENVDVELVMIEVQLPDGDGMELLGDIRILRPELPIVVLTRGERTPELYARALEAGANEFLSKPVLSSQLLTTIRDLTGRKRPTTEGHATAESGDLVERTLEECTVGEFLGWLHRDGASGACIVSRGRESRGIQIRNGSPIAISTDRKRDPFEEYLRKSGRISMAVYDDLVAQLSIDMGTVEEILLGMGALAEKAIVEARCAHAMTRLLDPFGWEAGRLRFHPRGRLKAGTVIEIDAAPEELLFHGAWKHATDAQIRRALESRGALFASAVEGRRERIPDLDPYARSLLISLEGDRPVSELLADPAVDDRLLYALWVSGLLELEGEPVLVLDVPLEEAPEDVAGAASGVAESGGEAAPADSEPADPGLGEERQAATLDDGAESLVSEAPVVETETESSTERAHEAESWFRTGRGHLIAKQYDKAIESFGMAAHLDPGEGEYSAHLGYVLYLARPENELVRREAMEHIAKGIKMSPERESPYLYLGRIFRETGEPDSARKVLRRANRLHPGSVELKRELRLLDRDASKPKGLLSRVFRR